MNNIEGIAGFEKVSYEQFEEDWLEVFGEMYGDCSMDIIKQNIKDCYNDIQLPKRSTKHSAGYDFYLPFNVNLKVGESISIPTGIRCWMDDGWVLQIYPRSSHGFKYGLHLSNSVGIIDGDYFYADNEGHIHVKLVNDSVLAKDIDFETGTKFCQGVFVPYGIIVKDNTTEIRTGGIGSTGK